MELKRELLDLEREKLDKPSLSTRIMTGKSKNTDSDNAAPTDAATTPKAAGETSIVKTMISSLYIIGFLNFLYKAAAEAFDIRLYAIKEYGLVIHEFDPYFNYRAAEVSLSMNMHPIWWLGISSLTISSLTILFILFVVSFFSICGQTVRRNFSSGSITCLGIPWDGLLVPQFILECSSPVSGSKC